MPLQAGAIIKSTAALDGTVFEKAAVLLTEYNANGAVGFVVNKPFARRLNELEEFKSGPAFPLYEGGPVDKEHLFFIHRRPDVIAGGTAMDGVYYGGDFKQAVAAINSHQLTPSDIKIFVGYCGWNAGELEAEVEEGSWEMTTTGENVFS